jgi:hypothetical protein
VAQSRGVLRLWSGEATVLFRVCHQPEDEDRERGAHGQPDRGDEPQRKARSDEVAEQRAREQPPEGSCHFFLPIGRMGPVEAAGGHARGGVARLDIPENSAPCLPKIVPGNHRKIGDVRLFVSDPDIAY